MKMHGPDRDQVIHVHGSSYGTMTLAQLYDIIHDRLEYVRVNATNTFGDPDKAPLSTYVDIDAVTQQCMVEMRKKLGLYKDELDWPLGGKPAADAIKRLAEPPVTTAEALEAAKNTPVQRHWYLNDDGMWKETKKS